MDKIGLDELKRSLNDYFCAVYLSQPRCAARHPRPVGLSKSAFLPEPQATRRHNIVVRKYTTYTAFQLTAYVNATIIDANRILK